MATKKQVDTRLENWVLFLLKGIRSSLKHYLYITELRGMEISVILKDHIKEIDYTICNIKQKQGERRNKGKNLKLVAGVLERP